MKTTKRQLEVEKFASNESRRAINSVYIRGNEAIATNGHILAITTAPDEIQNNGADPILIEADQAKQASKMVRVKRNDSLEMKTVEIDKEKIKAPFHHFEMDFKPVDMRYPNIDQVIPDYDESNSKTFAVDSRYLALICDYISKGQKGSFKAPPTVKITFKDKDSSILLEAKDDDGHKLKFVLMPVRL